MISQEQMFDVLLEADPTFQPAWPTRGAAWRPS